MPLLRVGTEVVEGLLPEPMGGVASVEFAAEWVLGWGDGGAGLLLI